MHLLARLDSQGAAEDDSVLVEFARLARLAPPAGTHHASQAPAAFLEVTQPATSSMIFGG